MREVLEINNNWLFKKDCNECPSSIPNWEQVNLHHTWNNIDGMDGGNDYFRGNSCYFKVIEKSLLKSNKTNFIEFTGVGNSATVYINGEEKAKHHGGYSAFIVKIDNPSQDAFITVVADNSANDKVYPQTADFTFYGGIYRDVLLYSVENTYFEPYSLKIKSNVIGKDAIVEVETKVINILDGDSICYEIYDSASNLILKSNEAKLLIKNVHLWNGTKDPYLYKLIVKIIRSNCVIDEVSSTFGVRTFEIDPSRGFILNGEEYPLRGVARHQDRWEKGNAISKEDHEEDMALIKEMGANTIRLAHYQHDQYFYNLCDKFGMVVWAEIPYISSHMESGNENALSQMQELICQNFNHPSIVVWGLSNEITMGSSESAEIISFHKQLNKLVHSLDSSRKTVVAALTTCPIDAEYIKIPNVVSYNHYFGWYGGDVSQNGPWFDNFHKKYPNIPIGCSEYGCEALNWHTSNPTQGDYTEEYQAYYHEELIKQFFSRPYLWATHVWNMFDFGADARSEGGENGQNHKGLVTIDRKYKKDAFYAYKAWLSKEPFVHITSKRYIDRVEDVTKVTVYSNLPEVELYVNGELLEKKKAEDHFFRFEVENKGETHLKAVAGDYIDESVIRKVEVFNENYRLKEKGAILNWFDINEVAGKHSLNSTIEEILTSFRGKLWFISFILLILRKVKKNKDKKGGGAVPKVNKDLLNLIKSFTVLRLTTMFGMINISITKEELLRQNSKLNKISKK